MMPNEFRYSNNGPPEKSDQSLPTHHILSAISLFVRLDLKIDIVTDY